MSVGASNESDQRILSDIRTRNDERKAAEATGIIGGARSAFDVDFLLRFIDANTPNTIETLEELDEYLQGLNYEQGEASTALTTSDGTLFFAFCTDPDGAWQLETGDPTERFEEDGDGFMYVPVELEFLRNRGPFTILHKTEAKTESS